MEVNEISLRDSMHCYDIDACFDQVPPLERDGSSLRHSERLDVHKWSDHPEVNSFVDTIYNQIKTSGNKNIRKKHVKTVLLDLYVRWCNDPSLKTAYSRNPNDYRGSSIYNELNISRTTIDVVDELERAHLVNAVLGFQDRATGVGFTSRMWPTEKLIRYFKEAKFRAFDVASHPDRVMILLRGDSPDRRKQNLEYLPTDETRGMELDLRCYNQLIAKSFILPHSATGPLELGGGQKLQIANQVGKETHRVFNKGQFSLGGRFYGPWWQMCPKSIRDDIMIDDRTTVEIDYSTIHPNLLYAEVGLDMWEVLDREPYSLSELSYENDTTLLRALGKQLLLMLVNVESLEQIPNAFRDNQPNGSHFKRLTNEQIFEAVKQLMELHDPISNAFASGAGIRLQNKDSRIAARIMNHFTSMGIPVLMVHDSFIVPSGYEDGLEEQMSVAFRTETGKDLSPKVKYESYTTQNVWDELSLRYCERHGRGSHMEEQADLELYKRVYPERTIWYADQREKFLDWIGHKGTTN